MTKTKRIGCGCDRVADFAAGERHDPTKHCGKCTAFWTNKPYNLAHGGDGNVIDVPPDPTADKPCGCHSCDECGPLPEDSRPNLSPRRNLLFHMHPVAGSSWRWHAMQLRRRLDLFDGRRVMAVTAGAGLDPVAKVRAIMPGVEIIEVANDPALREVATFEPLFSRLTPDPDEVTLYAQSKGATRRPEETAHRWAEILYETCCDHWPHTLQLLRKHPVVGPFLKEGRGWPAHESASEWHFSGSWFWFRNADLLSKPDWRRIDRFNHGIEPYPSLHFSYRQAGELFHRAKVGKLNMYDWGYLSRVIEPALTRWRLNRVTEGTA